MFSQTTIRALGQFPVADTRNPEEMRHALLSRYGATSFETKGYPGFSARSYCAGLGSVSIGYCAYGAEAATAFAESPFTRLQMALAGGAVTKVGRRATEVAPTMACVVSAGCDNRLQFGADYEQIFVRFEQQALQAKLAGILGASPRRPVEFTQDVPASLPRYRHLQALIDFAIRQLAAMRDEPARLFLHDLEQTMISALLEAVPHSYSEVLAAPSSDTARWHVVRAEEFIDAHWSTAIRVEDLARVTGIGARSLFLAFRRHRGYTPMAYVRAVRLKQSRALLLSPAATTTVTSVAMACGFSNAGHFSKDYQTTFGELPSATLARARR